MLHWNEFSRNRDQAYAWLLKTKDGDLLDDNAVFARDLYRIAKANNNIPQEAFILYRKEKRKDFLRKVKKKINKLFGYNYNL